MTTATINVSNATQLAAAIKLSTGGETINLANGNYGSLSLYKFAPTSMVTIQASPMTGGLGSGGTAAVFSALTLSQTQNVTFSGLEVTQSLTAGVADTKTMITVNTSSNLNFINLNVHGTYNHNPIDDMSGMRLVSSNNIQIADSKFHDLNFAAAFNNVSALAITGNTVYEVREGLDFSGVHHTLIDHNLIYSVIPNYVLDPSISVAQGDHPDMIQFWTQNAGGSDDVTISNNALLLGKGMDTHGIFITSQDTSSYSNFVIDNNLVSTNNYHGITVDHMVGALIERNTVLTSGGAKYGTGINVDKSANVEVSDNVATAYVTTNSTTTGSNNIKVHVGGALDNTNVLTNFVNPLKLQTTSVTDFAELAGGLAATSGAGFDIATYNVRVAYATYDALINSLDGGAYLHQIA